MTIRELRKAFKKKVYSLKNLWGLDGEAEFVAAEWATFEELYREGTVRRFSNEFLARANHYQFYRQAHKNLSILQTLDLHSISATKKVTRDMMAMFLNVGDWSCGYIREGGKYVEVEEETTAPEAEQTVAEETTAPETEIVEETVDVEVEENTEVEIEQTADAETEPTKVETSKSRTTDKKQENIIVFMVCPKPAFEKITNTGYFDTS